MSKKLVRKINHNIMDKTLYYGFYFVLFKEIYNNNELKYEIELLFPEIMVTYGESLEWRSSITAGRHYIGYFNKLNPDSTISITITR